MLSPSVWSDNLYLHVRLYLYLFNVYLFCIFSCFNGNRANVTLQLHRVLCDSNVTPMGSEYPLLSYMTILWPMKPEQKLCQSSVFIGLSHQ